MIQQLGRLYGDDIAKKVCDTYVERVKDYCGMALGAKQGFMESRKFSDGEAKTLVAMILSVYPNMEYSEIATYGYRKAENVLYHVKKAYDYLDVNKRFKVAFWDFRRVHRRLMDELFNIDIEEDWDEETIRITRISAVHMYLDISGKHVRIDMDDVKALGYIAGFVDRERGTKLLDRKKLLFNRSREDTT